MEICIEVLPADLMTFDLTNALLSGTAGRGMRVFWG